MLLLKTISMAGRALPERFRQPAEHAVPIVTELWRAAMNELASEVSWAFTFRAATPYLTDDRTANVNAKVLAQLRGQLARVRARFAERPYLVMRLSQYLPLELADVNEVVGELLGAVHTLSKDMNAVAPLPATNLTPQRVTFASLLDTYEKTFGSEAIISVTRTWESYGGPSAAFVRTTHEIAGCPIAEQALTTALQRHTNMQSRGQRT